MCLRLLFTLASIANCLFAVLAADYAPPQKWDGLRLALDHLGHNIANKLPPNPLHHNSTGNSTECSATCNLLTAILGNNEVAEIGSSQYQSENIYWSAIQTEVQPHCRVEPKNETDVAVTLLITSFFKCPFAVKSGGHAAFAGASNIEGGVTLDLRQLNEVQVIKNNTLTRVGAGNKWASVYQQLDAKHLSVLGGRVADIGVGGLTLGGGISFFSGRRGWACDGVQNYQVVLANGRITNVNQKSYPDLYFALRGGGNNFGIVTRFDLITFPQGDLWGGMRLLDGSTNSSIFAAFNNFAKTDNADPDAALIASAVLYKGEYLFALDLEYAKPINDPPIFDEINKIPYRSSTTRITNLTDLVLELEKSNPPGSREKYAAFTVHNNPNLQSKIFDIFVEETTPIANVSGIIPALINQPILKSTISQFSQRGGNALGISPSDGPLNLVSISTSWSLASDDAKINRMVNNVISRSTAVAKQMGLDNRFIYQNYATFDQDVFAGYGEENLAKLRAVSRKYDPEGVFQKLQPGYFKLGGV